MSGFRGGAGSSRDTGSDIYTYGSRLGTQYYGTPPPPGPYVVHAGNVTNQGGDAFADTPIMPNRPPNAPPQQPDAKESTHRLIGYAVGISSVCAEHVLSHPCIVLRRQCQETTGELWVSCYEFKFRQVLHDIRDDGQVNHDSKWFHLTPFTLFQVIFNIQRHQSVTTLWKGIGSKFMVRGITAASEAAISEFTPLPKEVTRHTSIKKHVQHLLLEGLSIVVTTPFYAASLVETVQSEIASERPGVLDCLREGVARLVGWSTSQTTRLLPVWRLVTPVVVYGLCHYVISSMAQYTVLLSVKQELIEDKEQRQEEVGQQTIFEVYYPELIATFTGNLLADTMLFPLETVMHRLLLQGTRTIIDNTDDGLGVMPIITRYEGSLDCVRTVIREEGVMGFYKGLGSLLLQYGLHMGILRLTKFILMQISQQSRQGKMRRSSLTSGLRHPMTTTATQMTPRDRQQRASEPAIRRGYQL